MCGGSLAKFVGSPLKKIKIGSKIIDCILIKYAHCFIINKSNILDIYINTIIEFMNASFFENIFPRKMHKK
jgi:hypothetical protein